MKKTLATLLFCISGCTLLHATEPLLLVDETSTDEMPMLTLTPVAEEVPVVVTAAVEEAAPVAPTADVTTVQIDGIAYRLFALNRTAEVVADTCGGKHGYGSLSELVIPARVSYAGEDYIVTRIAESAFEGVRTLRTIEIGERVDLIGSRAFRGCSRLKTVICHSPITPVVGEKAFNDVETGTPLYVPATAAVAYQIDETWGVFDVRALETAKGEYRGNSLTKRYYNYSGRTSMSCISFGYATGFPVPAPEGVSSTEYAFNRHLISVSLFEWRALFFGMSLFNFEAGINTPNPDKGQTLFMRGAYTTDGPDCSRLDSASAKTMWFAYKPSLKFYAPIAKWAALEFYGGVEVDLCKLWSKIDNNYYSDSSIPEANFFLSGFGGMGLMVTALPQMPIEVAAEYRYPFKGNTVLTPQGFYLNFRLHIATPFKK